MNLKLRRPQAPYFLRRILGRSLFVKYFFACASVLVLSFLALATAMITFSVRYSVSQRESMYLRSATTISQLMLSYKDNAGLQQLLFYSLQLSASNLEARIYISNPDGQLEGTFDDHHIDTAPTDTKLPAAVIKEINASGRMGFSDSGTLGGFFDEHHTSAVVPIMDPQGKRYGAVIVSSLSGNILHMVGGMLYVFLVCLGFVLLLAFVAIWFVTMRMVKPLRQMSAAAKSFAKGDFSVRVPVRSQDEMGELASAFNNMASSLASLEEMRRSFVANVSHELKTPMTSIAGFIDGILDGTIPPDKESHYLQLVSDEVKRLSRLVRSFLDIARIEAGELKINPVEFDVMEVARRVLLGFEQSIGEKQLEVRGLDEDAEFPVLADKDLTHQIVYNLVDNAVKFANDGGSIEINIAPRGKKVYIGVKNSGMGIPSAELPYVFDRFYKTDKSRSRDRKGVGLGLYIVKTVLNMQGEDIVVKSIEGEYCEFVFSLPKV